MNVYFTVRLGNSISHVFIPKKKTDTSFSIGHYSQVFWRKGRTEKWASKE